MSKIEQNTNELQDLLRIANSLPSADSIGGKAIIDVVELPTENIDENVFYRLLTGTFVYNQYVQNNFTCYCVDGLPTIGEPATNATMNTLIAYYNVADGALYGYIDTMLSPAFGIPVGWYPAEMLFSAVDQQYNGVIYDIADDPRDDTYRLLLEYVTYSYKDGKWVSNKTIGWAGQGGGAEVFNLPWNKAYGMASHAEGRGTIAGIEGENTYGQHAEGFETRAVGDGSHAEGFDTQAVGGFSHSEGYATNAKGAGSHAEGSYSIAFSAASHAEGSSTIANGLGAHSEGANINSHYSSWARGNKDSFTLVLNNISSSLTVGCLVDMYDNGNSFITVDEELSDFATIVGIEGNTIYLDSRLLADNDDLVRILYSGIATGTAAHSEGEGTIAYGRAQHVQGAYNKTEEFETPFKRSKYAHIVGNGTDIDNRSNAHTLDWNGLGWFAGGLKVGGTGQDDPESKAVATEEYVNNAMSSLPIPSSLWEKIEGEKGIRLAGTNGLATGNFAISAGDDKTASNGTFYQSVASGDHAVVFGFGNNCSGRSTLAQGLYNTVSKNDSVAFGQKNLVDGAQSFAAGMSNEITAMYSSALGYMNKATATNSFAAGYKNTASATGAIAIGDTCEASGVSAVAMGLNTHSTGESTATFGAYTKAHNKGEVAMGTYNNSIVSENAAEQTLFSFGIGTSDTARSNAFEIKKNGDIYFSGVKFDQDLIATKNYVDEMLGVIENGTY